MTSQDASERPVQYTLRLSFDESCDLDALASALRRSVGRAVPRSEIFRSLLAEARHDSTLVDRLASRLRSRLVETTATAPPSTFVLYEDTTAVATGALFPDDAGVLRWCAGTTETFDSIEQLEATHPESMKKLTFYWAEEEL